ncbi:glutamic acid-rich protein-like [Helianthus annuus]|uniref:glutamic acid-rich protein-like n=1 Tax=Helianthus annuus TaxID=4232 RepID=UPI000B905554|nr:glutamic acid-rich protein-like [Helianthus annuus]
MAENIKTDSKSWMYPRFVQMLIDHAYPEIDINIKNDLLIQSHMSNDSLKQLVRYHPNHPEPKVGAEFFGFIKDANYADPDPVDHQNWRNEAEMKEAAYAEELKILEDFKNTKNEWYVKETGRRHRKATPIVQKTGPTVEAEVEHVVNVEAQKGKDKVVDDNEGDDVDKDTTSSSSSSEEEVDETERLRRIQEATEQEKLLRKRKRQEKDDDDVYVPSPEHVSESQSPPGGRKKAGARDFDFANTSQVKNVEKKVDEVIAENKKLAAENKKVADRERILEMRVKKLEGDNKELVKRIDSDQSEIDILKVRVAELEEEKARRDEQNEYFKLKNKELEAAKAFRDHEFYMLNKVVESMLGTSVEQKFEEFQVEELRAERQAKIVEQMKDKGKGVEGSSAVTERSIVPSMVVENPEPISAISGLFEDETPMDELIGDSDEEDDEEEDDEEDEKDEKVYSTSSHGSDNDDDDAQGGTGLKVTKASTEKNVDVLMNDSVNEESGGADRQGESGDAQNVQHAEKLILRLDTYREEGEHFHTYTLEAIKEMTRMVNPDFKFDFEEELNAEFEEELNAFDINQQPEYEYRYVEEADMYDRVEVEDWTDDESVSEDTSQLPTLMEFFTEENRDELRRKVAEILKDVNFDGTPKDMAKEEKKKWFKESHERKFKRPLKYYQRDKSEERHCYVGIDKFEALRDFKHWKPHYPKRVTRRDPVTGVEETILIVKKPKTMKTIPVPSMEQEFYKGFMGWKSINSESKWKSSWWSLDEKMKRKAARERQKLDENRGKWMHIQAEEDKKRKKENDKIRNLLRKKPKQDEEKFKSL